MINKIIQFKILIKTIFEADNSKSDSGNSSTKKQNKIQTVKGYDISKDNKIVSKVRQPSGSQIHKGNLFCHKKCKKEQSIK